MKICIITADFNSEITYKLRDECQKELRLNDIEIENITCPGAVELCYIANRLLDKNKKYGAIILIGAVIKGDTDHYEYVCNLVCQSFASLIIKSPIPIIFGVLTTQNEDLALKRANEMNKGKEFAQAAIQMINVNSNL